MHLRLLTCEHVPVPAAGVVYNAQRINSYARTHWQSFARQPYFDDQGIFISALVSAPLLLIMMVQLVSCSHQGLSNFIREHCLFAAVTFSK